MTRNIAIRGSKKNPQFRIELLKKFGASNDYKHVGNDETGYYYINFHNEIVCNNPDDVPAKFIKSEGLHPILFSTEMVKAILEGNKTQTRRVVKPQPHDTKAKNKVGIQVNDYFTGSPQHGQAYYWKQNGVWNSSEPFKCPYGKPGDILWVRETFAPAMDCYAMKADYSIETLNEPRNKGLWKPSIHMPFEAARIFLRIKSVRVERLKDISEQDAVAEGIQQYKNLSVPAGWYGCYEDYTSKTNAWTSPRNSFRTLWQSINGSESWEANPWVWVVEFEKL